MASDMDVWFAGPPLGRDPSVAESNAHHRLVSMKGVARIDRAPLQNRRLSIKGNAGFSRSNEVDRDCEFDLSNRRAGKWKMSRQPEPEVRG